MYFTGVEQELMHIDVPLGASPSCSSLSSLTENLKKKINTLPNGLHLGYTNPLNAAVRNSNPSHRI